MSQSRFVPLASHLTIAAACRRQAHAGCRRPPYQGGQGAVEFLLAAAPVLLLGLSSIEAIHWYFVRQAVSLALTQAARAAITQHADPAVLDAAFTEALLPLHAGPTPAASQARLAKAIARREQSTGLPAWRIRIVSPSSASFADFSSSHPDLAGTGRPIIDNDYLQEQHQARLAQGWQQGRGPQSGQTTLEANTLALHLTWLHEPLLPGMRQLLKQLAPSDARYGSQAMSIAGYLPLHRQVTLLMQSHPIQWQMPAHGRLVRLSSSDPHSHLAEAGSGTSHLENSPISHSQPSSNQAEPATNEPDAGAYPAAPPSPPGSAEHTGPATTAHSDRQPAPCTGLWCLDIFRGISSPESLNHDAEANTAGHHTAATPPATEANTETDTDSGLNSDNPYRDADTEALAGPDDCPGCCD